MAQQNDTQAALEAVEVLTPYGNHDYNRGFNDCKVAAKVNIRALAQQQPDAELLEALKGIHEIARRSPNIWNRQFTDEEARLLNKNMLNIFVFSQKILARAEQKGGA